jgi:reactive chlorine resistance protein C
VEKQWHVSLVIGWIGMMKFAGYVAQGIEPLVVHSPLLSWMYGLWTVRQFAAGLGVVEICVAILISLRPWSRKASAIGAHVLEQTPYLTRGRRQWRCK